MHIKPKHSLEPSFILKNNYIKKGYLKTLKYPYNPFYSNNFLKVTIFIKSIHTKPKHLYSSFFTLKNNQIKKYTYKS